ncbi:MAG: isoprenoid biosynthesis glyoxalase ElbB [Deltaproteobacteria bacterium]|nr:isoprenoid biosynthesis glyoxalase ElbB [Deltaproteobacteria bacterium]
MAKTIAIVLAGCGNRDGSEIHESVLTILSVVKSGATPRFFAPDMPQKHVVNFLTGESMSAERNVLVEAARIARGDIADLSKLKAASADALIFPGGQGVAFNLCDFLTNGPQCSVHPQVERVVREFHAAAKPMGFICIAPCIAAKVLGPEAVELTIGGDPDTAAKLEAMGAKHHCTGASEIHLDKRNRVVSTAAYMCGKNIAEIECGISKLVQQVLELC